MDLDILKAFLLGGRGGGGGNASPLPGPLAQLPAPVQQGLGVVAPLAQTLPGVGALASPVGQAVARQAIPVGQANLLMALQRAKQEWDTRNDDTIPNPLVGLDAIPALRGRVGGEQLHYNPLRDVPLVGGAINTVVNGPLRALGLTGEAAAKVGGTAAGEIALLTALAQVKAADRGILGAEPNSDVTQVARAVVEQGWQHPGRAIHALRTGPDSTGAILGGALELATDPRNYAGGFGALGQGLEASGKAPALGAALKNAAFLAEVGNRLPLAPLAVIPRARRALLAVPEYMQPAGKAAAQVTPTVASLLQSAVDHAGQALPDGVPTPAGLPPLADLAPVPPPRATLPDLPAPTPPPVQIPLRVETPRLPREEIETLLLTGGRTPPPLRPTPPPPFPTKRPVDVSARAAEYLAGVGGRSSAADLPTALRDTPLRAQTPRAAATPAASNAITPEVPPATALDTPLSAIAGTTDPTGLIEMPVASNANALTPGAIDAPGYPTTGIEQGATATASGGPRGASAAAGLTPRQEWLDTLTGMPAKDKALLLRDLLSANYGGGASNALRAVLGRGSVADHQAPEVLNWLIQRTAEDPQALAKLGQINPPLANAIPTVEPAALAATDLQNGIRAGLGLAPKGAATVNPAQMPLATVGQASDIGGAATDLVDQPGMIATDWRGAAGPGASELLDGIEAAVRRGAVDEAEALVALAPDFGVPVSRARSILEAAADAGGSSGLADVQAQALEQSPYFAVFKYFNRDGALKKVNPRTGAPLLVREGGRLSQGRAEVWNIPGSGYDEVAAAALNDFGGYNPQWATNADQFWTQAREAFGQYRQLKGGQAIAPSDFLGDWGTGGGGIIPHPGGLPALNGQVAGALGGAAIGGGIGATQGDTDQARMQNALLGAGTGALVGGNLGGAFPQLRQATRNAVAGAQGKLASSAFSPTVFDAAFDNGLDAMAQSSGKQGAKLADLPAALDNHWRSQVTATFRNWQQDAINLALLVKEFGQDFGATGRDVDAMREQLGANLRNPDKVARYGDLGARLQAVGLDRLIDAQRGLADLLGLGQISESLSHGTQLSAGQRVAAGAGIGWAHSAAKISPLSPAFGAARGYLEPFIQGFFGTVNRLQHDAPRAAFLAKALDRDLPILADEFLRGLQTQGANASALTTRGGYFTPQEVAQVAGMRAGQEWATVTEGITRLRAEKIASLFGDFRDKGANATVADKAIGVVGRLFPFASWGLRYAPTLAEIAARHPVATRGLIGYLATEARQAKQEGRPGYQVGTIPVTTETPVLGAGVRVSLGGASGERRLAPLSLLTGPYGGELLSGPEELPDDATGYQRVKAAVKPLGLSPHPLLQAVMYATGQDYQAPGSLSRTAGLEGLPGAIPIAARAIAEGAGRPDIAASIPLMPQLPSGRALLDAGRQILSGKGAPDSDPATRRYAELVFKVTGRPLSDPRNSAYLEAVGNENEPLWQAAKAQAILGGAMSGALSFGTGLPTSGSTTEALAARQAPKLPYTSYQISQAPQQAQPVMQEANRRALADNPASGTYADISGYGRKATLMDAWDKQHAGLKRLTPGLYAERRKAYEQSISGR